MVDGERGKLKTNSQPHHFPEGKPLAYSQEKEVLTWNEDLKIVILIAKLRWDLLNYIIQISLYYLRMNRNLRNLTDFFFYSEGREELSLLKYFERTLEDWKTKNLHSDYLTKFTCSK